MTTDSGTVPQTRRWHLLFSKHLKIIAIFMTISIIVVYYLNNLPTNSSTCRCQTVLKLFEEGKPLAFPSRVKIHLSTSEKAYQRYVEKRKEKVGSNPKAINPWNTSESTFYYDFFLPAFSCPHSIQRIGRVGDGGKWTCGFDLYEIPHEFSSRSNQEPCIVYSFGVSDDSSYEAEFVRRTNCEVFAYDASVERMGSQISIEDSRIHFQKIFLKKETIGQNKTFGTIMRENVHTWIDFLKIDIEGGEYGVLHQILDEFEILPFGHLQVEIHADIDEEGTMFPTFYELWERLEQRGLRPFKNEVNHWLCVRKNKKPSVVEYSFINIIGEHRIVM